MSKQIDITQLGKTYEITAPNTGQSRIITVIEGNILRMALGLEPYDGTQDLDDYMERMYGRLSSFANEITDIYWHMCDLNDSMDAKAAVETAVNHGYSFLVMDLEDTDRFL